MCYNFYSISTGFPIKPATCMSNRVCLSRQPELSMAQGCVIPSLYKTKALVRTPTHARNTILSKTPACARSQWHIIHHLYRSLSSKCDNHVAQSFCREASLAVSEVVFPLSPEEFDVGLGHTLVVRQQRRPDALVKVCHEVLVPYAQGFRVVRTNVLDCLWNQSAFGALSRGF